MHQFAICQGRMGRLDFGLRLLLAWAPLLVSYSLPAQPHSWRWLVLASLLLAFSTALAALLAVRRLHDVQLSGWYALALLLPVVSLPAHGLLLLLPGTPAHNSWGPPAVPAAAAFAEGRQAA